MALHLEQKQVYGIIKGYDAKPEDPAANATATEKAAFKDSMNRHGVARSTILLGMDLRIQADYTVLDDAKTLGEKLASAYKSKLKLNISEIREDLWRIKLQDCGDVNNYASRINRKMKDYNLCAGPRASSTAGTDAADTDASAKTITKMSEQEHIWYLLRGIPRNDELKVFLGLLMEKNAMMTAMPDEIVTKLVEKEAAIKREHGLAPEALLCAKKGGKGGGGNGSKAGKGGKSPRWDKRDDTDDRKEKNLSSCSHCQRREHITENCLSKQHGNPPKAADTAAKTSTEASATSTLTTLIENYWMVASSSASSRDWFIDCGCMTHISGHRSIFITYTEYPPNTRKVKGSNGLTLFTSGCGSVRFIWQLPDGKTETIILQDAVHLLGSFNLISQSQIMHKEVKVEPVNHYGFNLYDRHGKLIGTAPQLDGLSILVRVLDQESTEYTDIDNSCLLALLTTGHASRRDAEQRVLRHRHRAHVGLKALEILPTITDATRMTGKCDCESCIKCRLARTPFTPDTTSRATEPLQLVHSDICGPLETAIRGGPYIPLFIDDATRHTDEYILKYNLEALEKFKEWMALREKESGKQVKQFCTDGGSEYTSKKFAECLKSEGMLMETTTPNTPQSNGVVEWANRMIMQCVWCMLDDAGFSKKHWAFAVSVAVYLKNCTPTRSVVGKTPYKAWHGSRKKSLLNHLWVFGCLAFVQVPKKKQKTLQYRATTGIFIGYSILTKQYSRYDPLAKMLHCSRDVVVREGKGYTAPKAAYDAILHKHFYRDVIDKPKPTEKQPTQRQKEEPLDDSPPHPPKPKIKSLEQAGLDTSLGDAWKPLAEGSHQDCTGKNVLAESAQLALEDEDFEDIIPIYTAAAISNDHEDGIDDLKSYKATTESTLADTLGTAMRE